MERGRVATKLDWEELLLTMLRERGVKDPDHLIEVCRRVANDYASEVIGERDRMDREKQAVLAPLLAMMREFIEMTGDMGPYDEIVGVAIKGPDGQIRVSGK